MIFDVEAYKGMSRSEIADDINLTYESLGYGEQAPSDLIDFVSGEVESLAKEPAEKNLKADNCGTGAGGFKPGNDCAEGHGRPPSDRRQGPVSKEEQMAFAEFTTGMRRIWNNNRNDPSQIERDADGNEYDAHEVESGAHIGHYNTQEEGVEMMRSIQKDLPPQEEQDLIAWTRNGDTVVDYFREGESRLDRADKKVKELDQFLAEEWSDEAFETLDNLEGEDLEKAVIGFAQRVRSTTTGIEMELRTAHGVLINQLPKSESGDPVIPDDSILEVLGRMDYYDRSNKKLGRMISDPGLFTPQDIIRHVRGQREMYADQYAPLKKYFKDVHKLERAYIDRLATNLNKPIRSDGEPVTVWRGIRVNDAGAKRLYDDILRGDDRFELTSVNSTSLSSSTAAHFARADQSSEGPAILLEIKARNGVAIGSRSAFPLESEILLPPRSNARIISKELVFNEEAEKPVLYVEMEMEDE
jgi:hypothetical protein